MIDFSKKLKQSAITRIVAPTDLYASLDRRSDAGPLRPAQESILNEWFKSRNDDKDIIVKLHTGEGKTLIGLLMLLSNMNAGRGPSLYICPNIYLAEQVQSEATKFGIPFCIINNNDNSIPNEFTDSKAVLITHAQKVFNGKSIFGVGNKYIEVGSILIDDSHACVETIRESFTLKIDRENKAYSEIKDLFEIDLKQQSSAGFYELDFNNADTIIPITYWGWSEKLDTTTRLLSAYSDENFAKYCWPLLKDDLGKCQAFISNKRVEISPFILPIEKYKVFHKAKHRILMSATTQNDAFFIKGLLMSPESIMKPITYKGKLWSGEKMILIPSVMAENFDRDFMVTKLGRPKEKGFGIVALTPSFIKADFFAQQGALIASEKKGTKISDAIKLLKDGDYARTIVFVNRYDGIDLPDRTCRILIFDSLPFSDSLADRFEEHCRTNSTITLVKTAQKIEQGLGRSVRGEKDYSVIIAIGADLVKFIKSSKTCKLFSPQTQMQVEIGFEIASMAIDESTSQSTDQVDFKVLNDLINQCLRRDETWKQYYVEKMDNIPNEAICDSTLFNILEAERKAENAYQTGKYKLAVDTIQKLIDDNQFDEAERGWYLQMMARFIFPLSKAEAQSYQKAAFLVNYELIRPIDDIKYSKKIVRAIEPSDIIRAFLLGQQVDDPLEYIKRIPSATSANFPIYFFLQQSKHTLTEIIELVNMITIRGSTKRNLLERLHGKTIPMAKTVSLNTLPAQKKNEYMKQWLDENVPEVIDDISYCIEAIFNLSSLDIQKHSDYIRATLLKIYNNYYEQAVSIVASNIRKAICRVDEALYLDSENSQ